MSATKPLQREALLVVGPKRSNFSPEELSELRTTIANSRDLGFLSRAIAELESLWPTIVEANTELRKLRGDHSLHQIVRFFEGGDLAESAVDRNRRDNILLEVFTVISHVVSFYTVATSKIENALFESLPSAELVLRMHDIQGFCLGFLTAAAVATAKEKDEFATNVTTVLRIAVCIGAIVEADAVKLESAGTEAVSLSIGWNSETDYEGLKKILSTHQDAYIACLTDVTRATITIDGRDLDSVSQKLSAQGLVAQRLPLQGRYHCRPIHEEPVRLLKELFRRDARFQLPNATASMKLRNNMNGKVIDAGSLHDIALDSILLEQCHWNETVRSSAAGGGVVDKDVIRVGAEVPVPRFLAKTLMSSDSLSGAPNGIDNASNDASAVAIIGMGCRFPEADSLEEFWEVLRDGISTVRPLPTERFKVSELTREPKGKPLWGNFLRHPEEFDHRFFGISGREAKSMDPQQRIVLQVAYETLESAGFFGVESTPERFPSDIGCYLGVGAVDYGDNVASHDASAFSALGTLRAFISGRISHYYGWSGPSITYDTACSSGAVAIHSAVMAIRSGECSLALAGGVNVITSPALWQNLAAASFLSPTGASKAFDSGANGYCRGEGTGLVLLKSLAHACRDGDSILAVITGSAVNQGGNCSPITVPVSDSQTALYRKALSVSGTDPKDVSFVEAHGTGTPVGDPIECESIRRTFGGSARSHELYLGSVKDNIGHTEAASGAAALIKAVLMMQKRTIPKQAGFTQLNPKIPALGPDRITIPLQTSPWTTRRRIAVINNYGAAGSNTAIVVQDTGATAAVLNGTVSSVAATELPFFLSAKDPNSLREYCKVLQANLPDIKDLAYNLAVKHNHEFDYSYSFTASTREELSSRLDLAQTEAGTITKIPPKRLPVVLCIGGQNGRTVHLDKGLYRSSKLLQKHLNACEQACKSLGLPSLFPAIFSPEPVESLVSLHSLLFSLQYASARAWLDAGLKVATIVGHSFGQLTALVVSNALTLAEGLRFITERARLIENLWGHETGAMLSVQGDTATVNRLLEQAKPRKPDLIAEIACYNGPQTIVLAGDVASMDAVEDTVSVGLEDFGRQLRLTRLKNTHAFHSSLVDSILPGLRKVADTLTFRDATIRVEACSRHERDWSLAIDSETLVQHTREPVYFQNALQRVQAQLGACVFLEAGSASPIIPMARRALEANNESDTEHVFQSIDLGPPNSLDKLARATSNLWTAGVTVQYWPFHRSQKEEFSWVNLPPYQFVKNPHWIEYVAPKTTLDPARPEKNEMLEPPQLLDLLERSSQGITTFIVNTAHEMFTYCTQGHAVLGQSLCPASMYVEIVIRAASLVGATAVASMEPCVEGLMISAPLSLSSTRSVLLHMTPTSEATNTWKFALLSQSRLDTTTASTQHATGSISFRPRDTFLDTPRVQTIRRLTGNSKFEDLSSARDAHVLHGGIVYQVFGQVVDYAPYYRGVTQIVSKGKEAVGIVRIPGEQRPVLDESCCAPIALDNFLQVAGIHVNCLSEKNANEVFVCTEMGEMFISDGFLSKRREARSYSVYTSFEWSGNKKLVNDIFVFDPETKALLVLFLGVVFQGMPIKSLARTLSRLNSDTGGEGNGGQHKSQSPPIRTVVSASALPASLSQPEALGKTNGISSTLQRSSDDDAVQQVRQLFSRVIEIAIDEVTPSATLVDLGVDSLMSTEILNEIKAQFEVAMSSQQLLALNDVKSVADYLRPSINGPTPPSLVSQHVATTSSSGSEASGTPDHGSVSLQQVQLFLSSILDVPVDEVAADTSLDALGIDSLMATEVLNEIKQQYGLAISAQELQSMGDVSAMARRIKGSPGTLTPASSLDDATRSSKGNGHPIRTPEAVRSEAHTGAAHPSAALVAQASFAGVKQEFDSICQDVGFADFYEIVYPAQKELVVAYLVEALRAMGCDLDVLRPGDTVVDFVVLDQHHKVKRRIYEILEDAQVIEQDAAGSWVRTSTATPTRTSSQLHAAIVPNFRQHAFEHDLLASTGSKLADCLTGRADPLAILFGSAKARTLMANVYAHAPMFKAGTIALARYLASLLRNAPTDQPFRILELGAGTGGTTSYLIESLLGSGRTFEYTFTDISSSLVAAARKKFAQYSFMRYAVMDIEKPPVDSYGQYSVVLSTNCIHATANLTRSLGNIRSCLRPDGVLCLVELTRGLFWFDLVFGLLEGWWLFEDGRQHALASEGLWRKHLATAGYRWIDWTVGVSEESNVLRVITASPADLPQPTNGTVTAPVTMETLTFKHIDGLDLKADVYYPKEQTHGVQARPVALMIHGGGHVMLSRKDVRPAQTDVMLAAGFLPVSIDYRLCPETTLPEGPMTDVRDALAWVRSLLPQIPLRRSDIRADGSRVAAVGWSTGGHLALTLGFTAPAHGIQPPDAVLAFYCPSDYEDPFWRRTNRPFDQGRDQGLRYDLLEGVRARPITGYNPPAENRALGGWMSTADARSRIALHMNWTGRYLRILLHGLPPASANGSCEDEGEPLMDPTDALSEPTQQEMQSVSPLAQIRLGKYQVPTFIIHGTKDDLIPWQQAVRTYDALRDQGVTAEIRILDGAAHLFDLYSSFAANEAARKAVDEAYGALARWVMGDAGGL